MPMDCLCVLFSPHVLPVTPVSPLFDFSFGLMCLVNYLVKSCILSVVYHMFACPVYTSMICYVCDPASLVLPISWITKDYYSFIPFVSVLLAPHRRYVMLARKNLKIFNLLK